MILHLFLPLYAASVVLALLAQRYRVGRRLGRNPIVIKPFADLDQPHRYLELVLLIGTATAFGDILLNMIAEGWVTRHLAIPVLRGCQIARWTGFSLLTAGLLLSSVAARQMGDSWRMGIDAEGPGALATRGLYRHIRHPIYSGMLLTTIGLAATTGDVLAAAVASACWSALPIQARLEEQFLLAHYGDEYRGYMQRTGRFVPLS